MLQLVSACEKYALNLPAIEQYIQKAIPVTDYDRSALLDDVTPPKHVEDVRLTTAILHVVETEEAVESLKTETTERNSEA